MRKKTIPILALAIVLASCGTDKEANKNTNSKERDTIVLAQLSDPKTMDPHRTTSLYCQRAMTQIYDRMLEIDENMNLIPGLAESWEQLDDHTTVFKLRKGIKFHNGDTFTSDDVAFSIRRAQDSPTVAHLYNPITEIETPDENTVIIKTEQPFGALLYNLSHKSASVLNKKVVTEAGEDYGQNPIGTGAYKLKEWEAGNYVKLEKNSSYFRGEPAISNVIIKAVPEENSKVIGLETGEIDIAADLTAFSRVILDGNKDTTLHTTDGLGVSYIGLNTRSGALQDKKVRQALLKGLDRQSLIDSILLGSVDKAHTFLAPPIFGHGDKETLAYYDYNPEVAKQLLEDSGYKDLSFKITTAGDSATEIAQVAQANWNEIGVDLTIEQIEWGTFLQTTGNGDTDMFIMSWSPSTGDGDYGLYPNFHSSQVGGTGNRTFFENKDVDKLLEDAKATTDQELRKDFYLKTQEILNEEVPVIPVFFTFVGSGARNDVKGYYQHPGNISNFYRFSFN